eukprot:1159768-Pelagomonas_calceolata.AAC.2
MFCKCLALGRYHAHDHHCFAIAWRWGGTMHMIVIALQMPALGRCANTQVFFIPVATCITDLKCFPPGMCHAHAEFNVGAAAGAHFGGDPPLGRGLQKQVQAEAAVQPFMHEEGKRGQCRPRMEMCHTGGSLETLVRVIIERLARRCGFEAVAKHIPPSDARLLTHIRKAVNRKARQRAGEGDSEVGLGGDCVVIGGEWGCWRRCWCSHSCNA